MKAIVEIFSKPLSAFLAFQKIKTELAESIDRRNAVAAYVTSLEQKRNEATANLYTEKKKPVDAAKRLVAIRLEHSEASKMLTETLSSLGVSDVEAITGGDEARETLGAALQAYADELGNRIEQLQNDAQEMASRSGVEAFEPPAVATLRTEKEKALAGVSACLNDQAEMGVVWRTYSPLIRIGAGTLELTKA